MDKIFYNQASASKLGWDPTWFGSDDFDEELVKNIKKWQRKHKVTADGLCGPTTYRRVWTERESRISEFARPVKDTDKFSDVIVHNGNGFPINWDKVVLWDHPEGLSCKDGTYTSYAGRPDRKPTFFVNHWDVCLSSSSCARVIEKRGISVHFCIDNDGTIYQLLDTQHAAWQAGKRDWNHRSIGVEISNAYYTKYQSWYEKNGYGPRPVRDDVRVHGRKLEKHLDFYPVQIQALEALMEAIHLAHDIPLESPVDDDGNTTSAIDRASEKGKFNGFVSHYHLTRRKIDCGGLNLQGILNKLKQRK